MIQTAIVMFPYELTGKHIDTISTLIGTGSPQFQDQGRAITSLKDSLNFDQKSAVPFFDCRNGTFLSYKLGRLSAKWWLVWIHASPLLACITSVSMYFFSCIRGVFRSLLHKCCQEKVAPGSSHIISPNP